MLLKKYITLLPILGVYAVPLSQRDHDESSSLLKEETLEGIKALMTGSGIPGLTIAITSPKGDEIINIGNATVFGDPVTDDTYWAIGSNSKLFTGVMFAMLAEDEISLPNGGVYQLDTPLIEFMPNFKMFDDNATQHATTLDLLSHSSGLPTHNYAVDDTLSLKDWYDLLPDLEPSMPFRSTVQYSNVNYAAAGYIIEFLTGRDFYEVMTERIINKLDLEGTYDLSEALASGNASNGFMHMDVNTTQCAIDTATLAAEGGSAVAGMRPPSCIGRVEGYESWSKGKKGHDYGGGGGVNLNGRGLLKWTRAITLAEGLPQSIVDTVQTPRFTANNVSSYAMGCLVTERKGYPFVYHPGSVIAQASYFARITNESIGVFLSSNDGLFSSELNPLFLNLVLDDLLDLPPADPDQETSEGTDPETTESTAAEPVLPPTSPRSPPSFDEYTNIFSHPGYGNFTLSPLNLSDPAAVEAVGLPPQFIALDLPTLVPGGETMYTGQALHAAYGVTLIDHLLFTHWDGPLFNYTAIITAPSLDVQDDEDKMLAQYMGYGPALFEQGKIGVYDWWQVEAGLPKRVLEEGNVEGAEVTFAEP